MFVYIYVKYRWELSTMDTLLDYMKLVFKFVIDIYDEFAKEMTKKGKSYLRIINLIYLNWVS